MFRLLKKIVIVIIVLAIISGLSGCGKNSDGQSSNVGVLENNYEFDTAAIIVGNHQNAPAVNLDVVSDVLSNVCLNAGNITIIENDGAPFVDQTFKVPEPKAGISQNKLEMNAKAQADEVCQYVKQVNPATPEVDTLGSIILASKMLSNSNGNKILIVHDPGISTTGMLDMTTSILTMDVDTIIEKLKENECIPNLKGVKVVWIGVGEPVGSQKKPSEKDYNKLKDVYSQILFEGGVAADDLIFMTLGEYESVDSDWPCVKNVEFAESSILSEDEVAFKKNSVAFVDNDMAYEQIKLVAESYNCNQELLVLGFASSEGSADDNVKLSQKRADKVGGILEEYGFHVTSVGLGYNKEFCINDCNMSGEIEENKARKNRKIVVMLADSSIAKEIIQSR